ncbi:MAG TPA: alpha/beta hydrolase [Cyclobacteriaceae bacterium]|nr:alpha/beta hydrolase [Cyclobacteriaceae bacterium]
MEIFTHNAGAYLPVGDARIFYEAIGDAGRPVLLLLHGGFGNMEDFNSLLPLFIDRYYVIGIDSRGQGKSTLGKEKLSYQRIQLDVEAVLQSLDIDSFSILGFSDGGIVAYRLGSFSSMTIERIITIGSRWNINDALLTKALFLKITADSWKERFPNMYSDYQRLNPEPDFELLTRSMIDLWLDAGPSGYPNENVERINCPTLVVRGEKDHLLTAKSVMDLSKRIKNSTLFSIPFAGHVAHQGQREVFDIVVGQFLQK